jgi:hypothetical protein
MKSVIYMDIHFFAKFVLPERERPCKKISFRKRETSQTDLSMVCGAQLAYQDAQKIVG